MSQSSNQATLDVVHKEIETTLKAAEQSLGSFLDDRDNEEELQNCIDCLNQLRGIFIVVELNGAIALTDEAVQLANEVPLGASDDKNGLLSRLSDAVFSLKRYSEYLSSEKRDFPELLLSTINQLRLARRQPVFLESHFHSVDENATFDLISSVSVDDFAPLSDFEHHSRRFRHIFQTGLLAILRDGDPSIALRLIARAAEGATRLSIGYDMSPFWALVHLFAESAEKAELAFTDTRKRLLMTLEKTFKEMAVQGSKAADRKPDTALAKEVAFLVAVAQPENTIAGSLLAQINCAVRYTEEERLTHEAKLAAPGNQVIESIAKAVNEDLLFVKEKLDLIERASNASAEDVEAISEVLTKLSGVLIVLNLPNLSGDCSAKAEVVKTWSDHLDSICEDELMQVADAIIGVEAAIAKYKKTGEETDHVVVEKDPDNHFLSEARMMVMEESHGSLSQTKRAISAYIESGGDKLHLANIAYALDCSRGGMFLMGSERVASIIASCEACIEAELINAESMPDEKVLETLADALSSVEYYIETMGHAPSAANEELLKISEDSLKSIGYEVAA